MASNALLVPPEVSRVLDVDELYRQLMQIVGRDSGLSDWGSNIYHTSYSSNSEFAHTITNQGTGGHLNVAGMLQVTNAGVAVTALGVTTLAATTANIGTANIVTLNVTGDSALRTTTVTGASSGNDQALFLQHGPGDGTISLGATNSATPDLIIKNNGGAQIARATTGGVLLAGSQTTVVGIAADADVQANDLWLTDGNNVRRVRTNGDSFQISSNATSGGNPGGTHLTIDSAGLMTIPNLQVDNSVNISNDLEVDDNVLIRGDLDVLDDVTIGSDLLVSGAATFTSNVLVSGSSTLTVGSGSHFNTVSGSSTPFTRGGASFDGYVIQMHNGNDVRVPYWDN